ncbi:MAG TPA: LysE family translocator [Usitatibacter sp.]|jgi:threonine/homoserine/homoserine lactone efflux protein|nr:LysE family translocator [Usitatibacter sp.]
MPSLALYIAASLALIATPGQDMLYVMARSIAQGRAAGLCSALGVSLGILVHTALAALGVGALLRASETLFVALKLAGALYLVFLGVRLLLSRAAPPTQLAAARPLSPLSLIGQGMLSNVGNPKIVVFFIAFLPQFVDRASAHPTRDLVMLGALYAAMAFPVKAMVAWITASLARRANPAGRALAWAQRAGGAILVGLGLRLAFGSAR